jgi:hypothetical protein
LVRFVWFVYLVLVRLFTRYRCTFIIYGILAFALHLDTALPRLHYTAHATLRVYLYAALLQVCRWLFVTCCPRLLVYTFASPPPTRLPHCSLVYVRCWMVWISLYRWVGTGRSLGRIFSVLGYISHHSSVCAITHHPDDRTQGAALLPFAVPSRCWNASLADNAALPAPVFNVVPRYGSRLPAYLLAVYFTR